MPVDDRAFRLALDAMVARVEVAARKLATDAALITEAKAKAHARQPLFAEPTGTTQRSIHTEPAQGGLGTYSAHVGPTTVYSRRLELGFEGPDSLGRVYHQAPRPYMQPGRREALPDVLALARRRFVAAIRA